LKARTRGVLPAQDRRFAGQTKKTGKGRKEEIRKSRVTIHTQTIGAGKELGKRRELKKEGLGRKKICRNGIRKDYGHSDKKGS